MAKASIYNLEGSVVGEKELRADIFDVKVNPVVVQQVVVAQRANQQKPFAHAKDRSEISGGGKKPWRQKGTGRARHGSIRSPLWRGGGVTFGPRNDRNPSKKVNRKMRKAALRMILSDKVAHDRLVMVENLEMPEVKTKEAAKALGALPKQGYRTLIVADKADKHMQMSVQNIPDVEIMRPENLNAIDMLKAHTIIVPVAALEKIEELCQPASKA